MIISVSYVGLNEGIRNAVNTISKQIFSGPAPSSLHHYTYAEKLASIISGRSIWGIPLSEQSDPNELVYATSLLVEQVRNFPVNKYSTAVSDTLSLIVPEMNIRKEWFFISCFCGNAGSSYHQQTYGNFCLEVAAPWMGNKPFLSHSTSYADYWYQRVIYEPKIQRKALNDSLFGIANALEANTRIASSWSTNDWLARSCARVAAQHLLAMAVGFKSPQWAKDEEWRLVCCPRLNPLTSAPKMEDENFGVHIRKNVRRHVEFTIERTGNPLIPILLIPPVPFEKITFDATTATAADLLQIHSALAANHRLDLYPEPTMVSAP